MSDVVSPRARSWSDDDANHESNVVLTSLRVSAARSRHQDEMTNTTDALQLAAERAASYVDYISDRNVAPARSALLSREGWNVEEQGLFGAPPIDVIVGDEYHASMQKALSMVGLGKSRVTRVATDSQGRMRADQLPPTISSRTIVCLQAG